MFPQAFYPRSFYAGVYFPPVSSSAPPGLVTDVALDASAVTSLSISASAVTDVATTASYAQDVPLTASYDRTVN